MNKTLKTVLAAGALIAGIQQSQAIPFRDAQNGPGDAGPLGVLASATGTFNVVNPLDGGIVIAAGYFGAGDAISDIGGFSPVGLGGTDTAISGVASFFVRDATSDGVLEEVTIELDSELFIDDGGIPNGGLTIHSGPISATILLSVNDDGLVDWTVTNTGESTVFLDHAILRIEAERRPPVTTPDGGATAALLGLGVLGVAAIRRKM